MYIYIYVYMYLYITYTYIYIYVYIYIYIQFVWFLPHTKKDSYCLWEGYDLNLSIVISFVSLITCTFYCTYCLKLEIYPVFYSNMEFLCRISYMFNLMAIIVRKECILQLMLFSGSGLLLLKHPIWLWPFPKGYKNIVNSYFAALATSPSLKIHAPHEGNVTWTIPILKFTEAWYCLAWNLPPIRLEPPECYHSLSFNQLLHWGDAHP